MTQHFFYRTKNILIGLFALSTFFVAPFAHAASISITPQSGEIYAGTPFLITVSLATDADSINALDGEITIPQNIQIVSISTGNSPVKLWPVGPVYMVSDHKVEFTGGTPGGLPLNTQNTLFILTVVSDTKGTYDFVAGNVHTYKNDGTGAKTSLSNSSSQVVVGAGGKGSLVAVAPDHTPPVFTGYAVGKDSSLFNDNYFVTFYATDAGSGVAYYEVQEGPLAAFVRADRYYVLHDQTLSLPITIRAVDKDGNIATVVIPAEHSHVNGVLAYSVLGLVILTILAMILYVRKHR